MIQGNFIGTKINGTQLLGNAADGIFVVESINNTIGGTVSVPGPPGNVIAGNAGNGIGGLVRCLRRNRSHHQR